ncbi:MAG TPA: LysM domain-containing protein, partial [Xanthomonadaceae bacterium]|nr:LysM domain-containing protein [Xanthomonadaceae bacterium]
DGPGAPATAAVPPTAAGTPSAPPAPTVAGNAIPVAAEARATPVATHTVARGESAWSIARRYGLRVEDLLARNKLLPRSVLRPGTVLRVALAGE